ncbi:MAG: exo-alpha-sialidase [bacterium]|nr:exo-alpha-sialidase [bacterium]
MLKKILLLQAVMVFTVLTVISIQPAQAGSLYPGFLKKISGPSPFGEDCGTDFPGYSYGHELYYDSEIEPTIAVNPKNPLNMVVVWQQDTWSWFCANGVAGAVTFNGGITWKQVTIPNITTCSGGIWERGAIFGLVFTPNGDLFLNTLGFSGSGPHEDYASSIMISKSTNGGRTWGDPIQVTDEVRPIISDCGRITADPVDPDYLYMAWARSGLDGGTRSYWFTRTTDGGESWEEARVMLNVVDKSAYNVEVHVLPGGDLAAIVELDGENGIEHACIRSTDRGETWSEPVHIANENSVRMNDPVTGNRISFSFPDSVVDPETGMLYLVWNDGHFSESRYNSIGLSYSKDGGLTWSEPVKVNKTPEGATAESSHAFSPSIAVAPGGTVGLSYFDLRNNVESSKLSTDSFLVHCHKDCGEPANWKKEVRLTGKSFDMRQAIPLGGSRYFLGYFTGLAAGKHSFSAVYAQPHKRHNKIYKGSIFFRRVFH